MRQSPSRPTLRSQNQGVLHIFMWDPYETRRMQVATFIPDGR